jgi:hypothetical protein
MPFAPWMYRFSSNERMIKDWILKPLVESYNIVKRDITVIASTENEITEKLVWHLKNNTTVSTLYQKRSIDILLRPKEQVEANKKVEPDIKFILGTRIWLHVEAKRIYEEKNWSPSEYVSNDDGIGRFLTGKYSKNDKEGGMLAYIQGGDLSAVIHKLKSIIDTTNCESSANITEVENCYLSVHKRESNSAIRIYHLFLYFS